MTNHLKKADFTLTKEERQHLVEDIDWEEPPTEDRKNELLATFQVMEDKVNIGMDNHGIMNCLCILERFSDRKTFAFQYGISSEETFWGDYKNLDDEVPVFEVVGRPTKVVEYVFPDGSDILVGDLASL